MKRLAVIFLFFLFSFFQLSQASPFEQSLIFPIKNYSADQYAAATQNWDVAELADGTLCFANSDGLLVRNGDLWQLYPTLQHQSIRSMLIYQGRIYVGGGNEFGYFERKTSGYFEYVSLSQKAGIKWGEIWKIKQLNDKIYFQGGKGSFIFNANTNKIEKEISFSDTHFFTVLNNELILQTAQHGLFRANPDLKLEKEIVSPVEMKGKTVRYLTLINGSYYIFTLSNGIFKVGDGKLIPCDKPIQSLLKRLQIYTALNSQNQLIIGTILDGVYVLDSNFNIKHHINNTTGLKNNTILSLYIDKNLNLWAGLDNGISKIAISSQYFYLRFNKDLGSGYASSFFQNTIYWGTNQGIYYSSGSELTQPTLMEQTQGQAWCMAQIGHKLYCGHHNGLYEITQREAQLRPGEAGVMNIVRLHPSSNFYILFSYHKVSLYKYNKGNDKLEFVSDIEKNGNIPRNSVTDKNGTLWSADYQTVVQRTIDTLKHVISSKKQHQLTGDKELFTFNNEFYIWHKKTLLKNLAGKGFTKSGKLFYTTKNRTEILPFIFHLETEDLMRIFTNYGAFSGSLPQIKKQMKWNVQLGSFHNDHYILNSNDGFIYYFPNRKTPPDQIKVVISAIKVKNKSDKEGYWIRSPVVDYSDNDILFRFNSNSDEKATFQYKLEGYDQNWSAFTATNVKEYTNLPEGDYTFRIRSKDLNGRFSNEATFKFTIEPPFYRSTVAYIIYIICLILSLFALRKFIKRLIRKKEALINARRQKEIEELEKNHRLEKLQQEKEMMQMENSRLEDSILYKQRELANSTHNILEKNNVLLDLKEKLISIYREKDTRLRDAKLKKIFQTIDTNINNEEDWSVFENCFLELHKNFFDNLKKKYPNLSLTELKLCAYIKLNKSSKEIAALMNNSIRGVETSRYRLRKKLGLDRKESIIDVLSNV